MMMMQFASATLSTLTSLARLDRGRENHFK